MTRSANREAVAYLEQALEAFRHLPENPELAIDLRLDLRAALLPLADFARMQDYLQEAEALARSLGDQRRLGQIATNMAVQHINAGDYSEALSSGREALAIGEALGDHFIEVRATSSSVLRTTQEVSFARRPAYSSATPPGSKATSGSGGSPSCRRRSLGLPRRRALRARSVRRGDRLRRGRSSAR